MNKQQLKKVSAKGDFIFHKEWLEIFQGFSVEKAGQIIKALADYVKDGIKPENPELAALCTFLFANVDIDRERIEAAHAPRARKKKEEEQKTEAPIEYAFDVPPMDEKDPEYRLPQKNMTEDEMTLWEKIKQVAKTGRYPKIVYGKTLDGNRSLSGVQDAFTMVKYGLWTLESIEKVDKV